MDAVNTNYQRTGENLHKHNMSNGHGPTGDKGHMHAPNKPRSPSPKYEFSSSSSSIEEDDDNSDQDMREARQTTKVLQAFLQSITSTTGRAEEIRRRSRIWFQGEDNQDDNRIPTSGSVTNRVPVTPTRVPLKGDAALQQVMSGKMGGPRRHQSDVSLVSSGSADSGGQNGTFHRTTSFTRAQRRPVLSELPSRKTTTRRSSEDIPQTRPMYASPLYPDSPLKDAVTNTYEKRAGSPVVHTRASSDPVNVHYDTTAKRKPHSKDRDKKSWLKSKFFKKKKDSSKQKDDSKDSATSGDAVTPAGLSSSSSSKGGKSHSDRRAISREDSANSRRRTPSPPGSPKRTPNLLRRISSLKKKSSKSESFSSSSSSHRDQLKTTSSSRDFDVVEEDGDDVPNGDVKSNSLPMDVKFSTKPHPKKHGSKEKDESRSVAVDGLSDHPGKSGRKSREVQRPNTLDIHKKKPSGWKKFKKIFIDSSSSSSDSQSPNSSAEDISQALRDLVAKDTKENELHSKENGGSDKRQIQQHSDLLPMVTTVRDRYQHRATKSMGDIDSQDKSLADIGKKLQRVAEGYRQLFAQQYLGPTGRTHTPDSYRHEVNRSNGHTTPITRSTSHTPASGGKVHSHSMKAYYNMAEASRAKGLGETASRRPRSRITRNEISHRPSGSFDSPYRDGITNSWSDRVQNEKLQKSEARFKHQQPKESPINRRHADTHHLHSSESPRASQAAGVPPRPPPESSHHSPSRHHPLTSHHLRSQAAGILPPPSPASSRHSPSRHPQTSHHSRSQAAGILPPPSPASSHHSPSRHPQTSHHSRSSQSSPRAPPAPTISTSPHLRSSRLGRSQQSEMSSSTVATDSIPSDHHIHRERHIDKTITTYSPGHTRTLHVHRDIIDDVVEADALPSAIADDDSTDYDMALAMADDDDITAFTSDTTETVTLTEEVDGYPVTSVPERRPRAATTPSSMPTNDDELDDDDDIGAVGGEDIDEDKLVSQLVEALCKKADEIKLDTPMFESSLTNLLATVSKEKAKEIVERALSKIQETTNRFTHPEIIQLAMLFNMADLFGRITSRPSFFEGLFQSFIKPIINRLGGWSSDMLKSSLDETEQEILDKESPSEPNHHKHRRGSDTDGELD